MKNQQFDILIKHAICPSFFGNDTVFETKTIGISDGKITLLPETTDASGIKNIDATGKLVLPGLVNTHTHAAMTVFRGFADGLPLNVWLKDYIFPSEDEFVNAEMVEIGTELAVAEMLLSGTTTFNDMYYFEDEVAKVVDRTGIRAFLNQGLNDGSTPHHKSPTEIFAFTRELQAQYKNHPRIEIGIAPHAPYSCSPGLLKEVRQFSESIDCYQNIHLAETRWEHNLFKESHGYSPTVYLQKSDFFNAKTIAAHCVHLDNNDIDILSEKGVRIAHNPECNMKLASGAAPLNKSIGKGINVGLGTDGTASNNNLDMIEEMHTCALLHKLSDSEPTSLPAEQVLSIATINGAKVLGAENQIGSIETSKAADLIIMDLNKPHLVPVYNYASSMVYSALSTDIETVIVDGKILVENRQLTTIDIEAIMDKVRHYASKIKASSFYKNGR